MQTGVFILHLGVASDGRLRSKYWHPVLEWLSRKSSKIVFESSMGGQEMFSRICGTQGEIEPLPSPAPEMEIESFAIRASGSFLKAVLEKVHYTADGAIEFVFFLIGDRRLASIHVEDDNYLVLQLTKAEALEVERILGDLNLNIQHCRSHQDDVCEIVGDNSLGWEPLGNSENCSLGSGGSGDIPPNSR